MGISSAIGMKRRMKGRLVLPLRVAGGAPAFPQTRSFGLPLRWLPRADGLPLWSMDDPASPKDTFFLIPAFFFFFFLIILFIYLRLCWVLVAAQAFLKLWLVGATLVAVHGLLIAVASLVREHGL